MTERPLTSLERLRETVALRVQATSLRAVARQVGMSPSGLEKFLSGGTPYSRSRQKLQDWWEREGSRPRNEVSPEGIEVAVGALVRDLPPEFRAEAVQRLIAALRDVYDEQGAAFPPWLDTLAAVWVPGAPDPTLPPRRGRTDGLGE
ncbi:MAG TPA: hypothetical protein VFJ16_02420 [Longimicrobium sp.]|nr:hypothetical protein [Longimicrobium sp.]